MRDMKKLSQSQDAKDLLGGALRPLLSGKTVTLTMDVVPTSRRNTKKYVEPIRTVFLTPGHLYGMPVSAVIVSIVGRGCAVLLPGQQGIWIADLVKAGMPARLASAMANALRRIYGE